MSSFNNKKSTNVFKNNISLVPLYFFWTLVFFLFTYIYTDKLTSVDKLNNTLNVANIFLENRILKVGIISICMYIPLLIICSFLKSKFKVKMERHKIIDSIFKVNLIGSFSYICGTMYAISLYLMLNPEASHSAIAFFLLSTTLSLVVLFIAFMAYGVLAEFEKYKFISFV